MKHLQDEIQLNPNSNLAHTEVAALLVKKGEVEEAIRHSNAALQLNPNDEYAHLLLARLFTQQHRDNDALPHLREVVRINPGQRLAPYGLGAILRKRGDSTKRSSISPRRSD